METLTNLQPLNHKRNFSSLLNGIVEKYAPEKIYCFGKNKLTNEKNGCFIENSFENVCHYFLLVVTETNARIENEIQEYANFIFTSGKVTILAHGKQSIAEAIASNNRFFKIVYNSAEIVYSNNGLLNREEIAPFIPTHAHTKALKSFTDRFEVADGFLHGASECFSNGQYNVCVFMLHQAVEQTCIALIRVYLGYRVDLHNLYRLLNICSCFSDQLTKILIPPSIEKEDRLFGLLVKSYSGIRYKDNISASYEDANPLHDRVYDFMVVAKEMCLQKISSLEEEAGLFKQLAEEREVNND